MAWRALTIVLLLASACPPPRVSNALIAGPHRHDQAASGRTLQARGRNRIGSPLPVAACRRAVAEPDGRRRAARPVGAPPPCAGLVATRHLHSRLASPPAFLSRLRC